MSLQQSPTPRATATIIGEPEVLEDGRARNVEHSEAWLRLKSAVETIQSFQQQTDRSFPAPTSVRRGENLGVVVGAIEELLPRFPHESTYLRAVVTDLRRWADGGFGVPDFLDSLVEFQPQSQRSDGLRHLIVFPMYTQNGSPDRHLEAVLAEVIWPRFVSDIEAEYSNSLFVPLRLLDFTSGYATNSAVLFPETVALRELPRFAWGALFEDREAARYRRVVRAAAEVTKLAMPADATRLLADQRLAEQTFVLWDLLHDRTHMRGDLPFDPFMIKQRMPYFLYALEELRCDLTAYRQCRGIENALAARANGGEELDDLALQTLEHARLVQFAVLFDRIFRFAVTGSRVRNYDGLGGQLLFAWLHQHGVLHWTDGALSLDWPDVPAAVVSLSDAIDTLYWRSIDRPKTVHWLAAYDLIRSVLTPHPASSWARGLPDEVLAGPPGGYTDAVLDDEFPLSMFYEALEKKIRPVIDSTVGITGGRPEGMHGVAGRTVLVAGATSTSGLVAVRALLAAGARCLAAGRDAQKLEELERSAPGVERLVCDLSDEAAVAELADRVHDTAGALDGVLHLVGGWRGGGGLAEQSDSDYRALEHSFTALRYVSRAFDEDLRASQDAREAVVSSVAVDRPQASNANYVAVKAASEAWAKAVGQGFARAADGEGRPLRAASVIFRVNSLSGLETDLADAFVALWDRDAADVNGDTITLSASGG